MTDAEIICEWMEPKPTKSILDITRGNEPSPGKWWNDKHPASSEWYPRRLTLDDLREVQKRLTDEQWVAYIAAVLLGTYDDLTGTHQRLLSATPEQKIKALASVRRAALAAVLRAGIRTPVEGEKP